MIKLIVTDMDGTLLDEKSRLNPEIFDIIKKLDKKGVTFAVASGRQYMNLKWLFEPVIDLIYILAENGTYITKNGEEIFSDTIDKETVKSLVRAGKSIDGAGVVLGGKEFTFSDDMKTVETLSKSVTFRYNITYRENLEEVDEDVLKVSVFDRKYLNQKSLEVLVPNFGDRMAVAVSGRSCVDVTNKHATKGSALRVLQELLGVSKEETMVFGDNENDFEMFDESAMSYAMENAADAVKKRARFIAGKNSENGVIKEIKKQVLGED